jgi:hypothetical protein
MNHRVGHWAYMLHTFPPWGLTNVIHLLCNAHRDVWFTSLQASQRTSKQTASLFPKHARTSQGWGDGAFAQAGDVMVGSMDVFNAPDSDRVRAFSFAPSWDGILSGSCCIQLYG